MEPNYIIANRFTEEAVHFDTARKVAIYMMGRLGSEYVIIKDKRYEVVPFVFKGGDVNVLEEDLKRL